MTDGGEARCDTLRERFLDTVADEVVRSLIARIGRSSVERARDPPDLRTCLSPASRHNERQPQLQQQTQELGYV